MDPILNEKELDNDLNTLVFEAKWRDAWGQHPAISYGFSWDGYVNLRNLVNKAAHKIRELQEEIAKGKV
jgi:hypothetical protein